MTVLSATHPTLAARLWPEAGTLRIAGLLLVGSALLALSARVQIPVWPVPITMQTFAVLVIGMTYGRNLALGTVLVYLAEGAIGLPVFASGAGLAYFVAAPSAGYLIGFAPAAALVGLLAERGWDRSVPATLAAMALGTAVIFLFGVLGLLRYMIAVAGLAVELGLLMMLYLDLAYQEYQVKSKSDLRDAIIEGASRRIRPMVMTGLSTSIGLAPIMLSTGAGADVMKRIAAPMVGGVISALLTALIVFPAIYFVWRGQSLEPIGR